MNSKIMMSALTLALAAPLAFAQQPPQAQDAQQAEQQGQQASGQITWEQLDADGDGNISREEATRSEGLSGVFDAADGNSDGNLTIEEYRAYAEAQANPQPAQQASQAEQPQPQPEPEPEEDPTGE
ncbi:MAG: EF-hand domain-containing protein [Pseudoxanthomonas suwonensis]|nr:EF-hand domain-containing protein [Pseudoxanthomonas suwonensis]